MDDFKRHEEPSADAPDSFLDVFSDRYGDYFNEEPRESAVKKRLKEDRIRKPDKQKRTGYNKNGRGRKGLKWKLLAFLHNKPLLIGSAAVLLLVILIPVIVSWANSSQKTVSAQTGTTAAATTEAKTASYQIEGVSVKDQSDLMAGCETYACIVVLQYLNFDIDEHEFVDNYLITKPVAYGEDGVLYGPDMNSAFAGDIYTGYGIYAPAMAKCMNSYLKTTGRNMTANVIKDKTLDDLCREYIDQDIPVMVWATGYMADPYIRDTWIVNYVDENATKEIGDTEGWYAHEHCMVLFGYDEDNYYFSDSVAGAVSVFSKSESQDKFEKLGSQAIVVK